MFMRHFVIRRYILSRRMSFLLTRREKVPGTLTQVWRTRKHQSKNCSFLCFFGKKDQKKAFGCLASRSTISLGSLSCAEQDRTHTYQRSVLLVRRIQVRVPSTGKRCARTTARGAPARRIRRRSRHHKFFFFVFSHDLFCRLIVRSRSEIQEI